jgi:hypothetical protein
MRSVAKPSVATWSSARLYSANTGTPLPSSSAAPFSAQGIEHGRRIRTKGAKQRTARHSCTPRSESRANHSLLVLAPHCSLERRRSVRSQRSKVAAAAGQSEPRFGSLLRVRADRPDGIGATVPARSTGPPQMPGQTEAQNHAPGNEQQKAPQMPGRRRRRRRRRRPPTENQARGAARARGEKVKKNTENPGERQPAVAMCGRRVPSIGDLKRGGHQQTESLEQRAPMAALARSPRSRRAARSRRRFRPPPLARLPLVGLG